MREEACSRLFVYGTLRSDVQRPRQETVLAFTMLETSATNEGRAQVRGRLYAPSWYPAFVARGEGWVLGEVWSIRDDRVLALLDAYENPIYSRERRTVIMTDGREVTAWVYCYLEDLSGVPPIPSGDYLDWVRQDAARA